MNAPARPFAPSRPLKGLPEPAATLIREFVAQADVSDRTRIKYRSQLAEFARWLDTSGKLLAGATRPDVIRFMAYLAGGDRWAAPTDHCVRSQLSASTKKSFLASLRALYRYLVSVDLATADPTDGVPRPKVRHKPGLLLTAEEVKQLLNVKGAARDRVQAFLLVYTAARVEELRRLRWQDIDLDHRTMMLHGKGDKYRMIAIHPRLVAELRRYRLFVLARAKRSPDIGEALDSPDTAYVLLTRTGRQLTEGAISKQLKRRATKAGWNAPRLTDT